MNHYFSNNPLYTDFSISNKDYGVSSKSTVCRETEKLDSYLLAQYDRQIEYFKSRVGKDRSFSTLKKHQIVRQHLADFIFRTYGVEDIEFSELTEDFIKEFCLYLTRDCRLRTSTAWIYQIPLKHLASRAFSQGVISRNPFTMFHLSPEVRDRSFLTEGELKNLMDLPLKNKMLDKVRDLFVFSCFTGLSFADLKTMTKKALTEHNGCQWIISRRKKTGKPFQIKILEPAHHILEKYGRNKSPNTPVFGRISHNYLNIKIKQLMAMCGINKLISFHCARHTFATMALNNGMSLESVGQILGHSSIRTTQIYAKITIAKLDKDFSVLDNNISDIFW